MSTTAYDNFKQAFLDQVAMRGYDADFIEGFFKRAEDEYLRWEELVQNTYKGDANLCKQAYIEAAYGLQHQSGEKTAEGGMGPELLGLLDQLGGGVGSLFGSQQGAGLGGAGLGGAIAGGGGGMLLGFLLSQMFDIPLPAALMLGALGGGALGYGAAGTQAGQKSVFGVEPPPPAAPPRPNSIADMRRREEQPGFGANPTAAAAVAGGQQVSNAAATPGAQPPPAPAQQAPAVQPPKPALPAQPGAAGAAAMAPQGGTPPVTPPGGAPGLKPPGSK